ncbi:MAG: hypothetical protein Q7I99_02380, partial [Acholeplasmataceae bacterium]|nr:hypothetical protein [Acholeplasmataceae bacterium]
FSLSNANDILTESEWKYESDGITLFDSSKATSSNEYYRYNALGEALEIAHFGTETSSISPDTENHLRATLPLAGIKFSFTRGSFDTLLNHYYYSYNLEPAERKYHMFYLATNFFVDYDPYSKWHSNFLGTWMNANQFEDSIENPQAPLIGEEKTIDELTLLMREVNPGDYATYLTLWRAYQLRWNKLMPNIPIYANQYYDVYDVNLKGVESTPFWDWTYSIYDMYFEG